MNLLIAGYLTMALWVCLLFVVLTDGKKHEKARSEDDPGPG